MMQLLIFLSDFCIFYLYDPHLFHQEFCCFMLLFVTLLLDYWQEFLIRFINLDIQLTIKFLICLYLSLDLKIQTLYPLFFLLVLLNQWLPLLIALVIPIFVLFHLPLCKSQFFWLFLQKLLEMLRVWILSISLKEHLELPLQIFYLLISLL